MPCLSNAYRSADTNHHHEQKNTDGINPSRWMILSHIGRTMKIIWFWRLPEIFCVLHSLRHSRRWITGKQSIKRFDETYNYYHQKNNCQINTEFLFQIKLRNKK